MHEAGEQAGYPMTDSNISKLAYIDREQKITVGENIDLKIAAAKERLAKLEAVKQELEASGLLGLKIASLTEAMRF